jgi:nucleotide sugar dehydrogenase
MVSYSVGPSGKRFVLPSKKESKAHMDSLKREVKRNREKGRKIVVVQGLGFVGAINAAVIADTKKGKENPFFVIGVDRPTSGSYWKIAMINSGECPFKSEDPEVDRAYKRTVVERKNFVATWLSEAYSFGDIILVDINLDVEKPGPGNARDSTIVMDPFKKAIAEVGKFMRPDSLVLIETTVPPGTTRNIVGPILRDQLSKRGVNLVRNPPLIAHSYERIMPGKDYVNSVRNIWRTYSGVDTRSKEKAREFLEMIGNTKEFPVWELETTDASEMAKILENSYRAMNIAFIHEWTRFAEDIGVNLFEVVRSIRVRKGTHDNMMFPGFGVGGYCLTKDPLLAQWASKVIFNRDDGLDMSVKAVDINDLMPDHTFDLLLKGMDGNLKGKKIAILGASYRKDIDDTRNSPTIRLYDRIKGTGGRPFVHDPYAKNMMQREDIKVHSRIDAVLKDASAVVLVVDHRSYIDLSSAELIGPMGDKGACVVDAFNILTDRKFKEINGMGLKVLGVGKGHIKGI